MHSPTEKDAHVSNKKCSDNVRGRVHNYKMLNSFCCIIDALRGLN